MNKMLYRFGSCFAEAVFFETPFCKDYPIVRFGVTVRHERETKRKDVCSSERNIKKH